MMNRKRPLVRKDVEIRRKKLKLENKAEPKTQSLLIVQIEKSKALECQANSEQDLNSNWASRLRPNKSRTGLDWVPRSKSNCSAKLIADETPKSTHDDTVRKYVKKLVVHWKKKDVKEADRKVSFHEYSALVHYCILGSGRRKPFWCVLRNFLGSAQFVLFRINCSSTILQAFKSKFQSCYDYFSNGVRFKFYSTDRDEFWMNVLNVNDGNKLLIKKLVRNNGDFLDQMRPDLKSEFNRLHLLVTLDEMADHGYPIPDSKNIATKDKYKKLKENSPIFVLDCEMCQTRLGSEVTRVSVLDEKGKVFFDTLVMPDNKIIDYVTQFSGMTEEILSGVTTTLSDVQEAIKYCLPDDAILCGHSFQFDLIALQLSHPYCIDIGLMYNLSGKPSVRTGLKNLTKIFMKKEIQGSDMGHCSVEDCKATLELMDLKLANDYAFGNVIHGFDPGTIMKPEQKQIDDDFQQTPVQKSVKPPKTVVKYCKTCKEKFSMVCAIDGCSCKSSTQTECCKCMVIRAKRRRERKHHDSDEEYFDWNEATKMEGIRNTTPITSVLNKANKGLLCAIKEPKKFLQSSAAFCKISDIKDFKDLDDFATQMGETMYEYKLSCFEHDLTSKSDEDCQKLDETILHLVSKCTNRNTVCSIILSSKKDSLAFVKVRT